MHIKEKIQKCLPTLGGHVHLSDTCITEIFASFDYDYIWVDMEHTTLTPEQVRSHIMAAKAHGCTVFVRVPVDDLTNTKRILEMNVDGIVFPMVRDYEHAKSLIAGTLYPPLGSRGCGPKGAVRFGIDDEPAYYKEGHLKLCRFVQIEQKSAAMDAERIASIPYLDGCVLGMHDLSGSIGRLGDIFCEENLALANHAIRAFQNAKKTVGISTCATDRETLTRYRDMGINMITAGADFDYIVKGARSTLALQKEIWHGETPESLVRN